MTRLEVVRRVILADFNFFQKAGLTAIFVVVPTALRVLLGESANPVPFVTYFPAVLLVATFLGWRWATVATILSAAIVNRIFLAQPWLQDPQGQDIAMLIFFGLSCAVLILTGDTLRRTVRQMDSLSRERDLLSGELYHRIQNVLSIVMALVQMGRATEVDRFREDLAGRIQALSKANRVLQDRTTGGEDVGELIEQAIAPFRREGAMFLEGPARTLAAGARYQLVLVLHELCTNALKHGALSAANGQVHISWTGEHDSFRLEWREVGGPAVVPPIRKGLGSKLLASQTAFGVQVEYDPSGIVAEITLVAS